MTTHRLAKRCLAGAHKHLPYAIRVHLLRSRQGDNHVEENPRLSGTAHPGAPRPTRDRICTRQRTTKLVYDI